MKKLARFDIASFMMEIIKNIFDAPFQLLSHIGGSSLMRCYGNGLCLDNHLIAAQMEYRVQLRRPVRCVSL